MTHQKSQPKPESSANKEASGDRRPATCSRSSIVDFIRRYNQWRRGDESLTMESPEAIGEALDAVCDRIETLERWVDEANQLASSPFPSPSCSVLGRRTTNKKTMNAKEELLEHIEGREVKYVRVICKITDTEKKAIEGTLDEVLTRLDFEYHSGYGSQELEGIVWYSDGTWSERGEYDGMEWWEHRQCPSFPNV